MTKTVPNPNVNGSTAHALLTVIAGLVIVVGGGYFAYQRFVEKKAALPPVNGFEDCVKAGYPVAESYPRQCHSPDGRNFVEDVASKTTPIDTSDWKIYRNETYGFEVRHPGALAEKVVDGSNVNLIGQPTLEIGVVAKRLDSNNLEGTYGRASTIKQISIGGREWFTFSEGDGGCRWQWAFTSLNKNILRIRFVSCEGEEYQYDDSFIEAALSTVSL